MRFKPRLNGAAAADSDSGRSPSDDEKAIVRGRIPHTPGDDLPPDPDEHLSLEERAKIVSQLRRRLITRHSLHHHHSCTHIISLSDPQSTNNSSSLF